MLQLVSVIRLSRVTISALLHGAVILLTIWQ